MDPKLKALVKDLSPPVAWRGALRLKQALAPLKRSLAGEGQDLDIYWTPEMAAILETWGDGNAWLEIQLLMANLQGSVLDIACGTGKVMELLDQSRLEVHGCDISDMLIDKALQRGIARDRLTICDATNMPYPDGRFDYSYSIGSLEHFTEEGIDKFVPEAARVTRVASFHMMPTSRSGRDEGWMKTYQTFHNNSPAWWVSRFEKNFKRVRVLDSNWNDNISVGKWFLCFH